MRAEPPGAVAARLAIPTPDGVFLARYSERGLCELSFPSRLDHVSSQSSAGAGAPVANWHTETTEALACALAGQPLKKLPPLDLSSGTDFQQSVWQAMLNI